jgi:hypothetical protein
VSQTISALSRSTEIDALCSLLRTELSACEAYRAAVHAVEQGSECPALSLRHLYRSHRHFADELLNLIRGLGAPPAGAVGEWGVWSGVLERIAALNGREAAVATLRALRHGEVYSLEVARGALQDLEGPPAEWVKGRLVEGIVANFGLLEALETSADDGSGHPAPA